MSVNPELLDTAFEATKPYVVGREKVREFASAVFATASIHHDVDAACATGGMDWQEGWHVCHESFNAN